MELVAVCAVGLGLARWHIGDPKYRDAYSGMRWSLWLKEAAEPFYAGAAVVGCAGVWAEFALRRGPRPWGPGRGAWSFVGLYLLLRFAFGVANDAIRHRRFGTPLGELVAHLPSELRVNFSFWLLNAMPYVLLAILLTRAGGGRQPGPAADAREWSGRIFAALIVVSGIALNVAVALGY
jgi:hypothetical protein